MNIFLRFNRKQIQDRDIDTLIGLAKGITADGMVNQAEAEMLQTWLVQHTGAESPVVRNLLEKISLMLEDGILDKEESTELLQILRRFSGEPSELGEVAKPTSLPLCSPAPQITFPGHSFLFTGTCAYGSRKQCQQAIESLGGQNANSVTKKLNYLIIGSYVTDSWAHESFGRKIEKAMEYRESGVPLRIVCEEYWISQTKL
ncbi:hypothetical protein GCM10009092_10690 [Bowmanella denitrificans]|uniref:BRCT domain-containing protein n=1 Tax=Bowmanella denitrificans TaxID=366582 RepID=A0ABN0WVY4_9ALTE